MTLKEMMELDKKSQVKPYAKNEPVEPIIVDNGHPTLILCCRRCKKKLKDHPAICPYCEQVILWS